MGNRTAGIQLKPGVTSNSRQEWPELLSPIPLATLCPLGSPFDPETFPSSRKLVRNAHKG